MDLMERYHASLSPEARPSSGMLGDTLHPKLVGHLLARGHVELSDVCSGAGNPVIWGAGFGYMLAALGESFDQSMLTAEFLEHSLPPELLNEALEGAGWGYNIGKGGMA